MYTHCIYNGIYNEVLLSHKKWNLAICNMDGSRGYNAAKWKKSIRERQISYDLTHTWDLRNKPNEQRKKETKTNKQTKKQKEKKRKDIKKKKKKWGSWVVQMVGHTTSAQVMFSWLVSSSPASVSVPTAQRLEPGDCFRFCISVSLCPFPSGAVCLSISVSQK